MERLILQHLKTSYLFCSEYRRKDFEQAISDYRCRWLIKACYNAQTDMYEFTLDRKDISISHQENLKLMDKISMEMGNAFYPLQLLTVPTMGVQKIVNLGDIKRRWTEKAAECRLAYPGEVLEQYLEDSENNMSNDRKLCKYLYRDSFINMYFRNMYALTAEEEREFFEWYHFPQPNVLSTYFCTIEGSENKRIFKGERMAIAPTQTGTASGEYLYGNEGDIREIKASFSAIYEQYEFEKRICIIQDNEP